MTTRPTPVESRRLEAGTRVHLFRLDATVLGGGVYNFSPDAVAGSAVMFGGTAYTAVPIEASGFEATSRGSMPQPRIRVSNTDLLMAAAVAELGDLVGATFTRWRTYARYLDDGDLPDSETYAGPDIYTVDQKLSENRLFIEWRLASIIDQQDVRLPSRQVLRNVCQLRYRVWDADAGAFDYSNATCPYVGSDYFKTNTTISANPADDQCGKLLIDCQARFGDGQLPATFFPAVGRVKGAA